jgi:hypothetical protein
MASEHFMKDPNTFSWVIGFGSPKVIFKSEKAHGNKFGCFLAAIDGWCGWNAANG